MAKRFNRSRGGKVKGKFNGGRRNGKKPRQIGLEEAQSPSPSTLDDIYENHLDASDEEDDEELEDEDEDEVEVEGQDEGEEEEIELHREPSVYDDLLKKLEAGGNSQAKRHCERKRVTEDEGGFIERQYGCESGDLEGSNNKVKKNGVMRDAVGSSDDEAFDVDEDDVSDTENAFRNDDGSALASTSQSQSNFGIHIAHKLLKEDIEKLLKRKWKYKWEIPAFDSASYKWMGTGERIKDADVAAEAPYSLKLKLYKHWLEVYNLKGGNNFHSSMQRLFFSLYRNQLPSLMVSFFFVVIPLNIKSHHC